MSNMQNTQPVAGDVIAAMNSHVARSFPEGTILEAESPDVATVAYKCASQKWTFTGFFATMNNLDLANITNSRNMQWLVVRVGEHEVDQ